MLFSSPAKAGDYGAAVRARGQEVILAKSSDTDFPQGRRFSTPCAAVRRQ